MKKKAPVLISVPHGGNRVPTELKKHCSLTPWDLFEDSDGITRDIYDYKDRVISYIDTPIARATIDLNRRREDIDPRSSEGVIKTKTASGAKIYTQGQFPGNSLSEALLKKYYDPYHRKLDSLLKQHPVKFALDCHSMDPSGPKFGKKPGERRPTFCLSNGGDSSGFPIGKKGYVTCSPTLIINFAEILAQTFKISEDDVLLNDPFPGGHIIRSHYSEKTPWIQLEINKKLYLSQDKFDKRSMTCFPGVITKLKEQMWQAIQKLLASV